MTDFNQAIILGNVTKDPEMRYTPNGRAVISFSVATNRRWTNQEGQQQEETEFHNIVAWGKLAEICSQILYKGRKVLVAGRLRTRTWEGQDGVQRRSTEIIADNISATGAPKAAGEANLQVASHEKPSSVESVAKEKSEKDTQTKKDKNEDKGAEEEINLDDIPF